MNKVPATQTQGNGLHPEVESFIHDVSNKYQRHDAIVSENSTLRSRSEVAESMVEHLKAQLKEMKSERDHYMRLSFEFTTRINSIHGIVEAMVESAQHATAHPGPARLPGVDDLEAAIHLEPV